MGEQDNSRKIIRRWSVYTTALLPVAQLSADDVSEDSGVRGRVGADGPPATLAVHQHPALALRPPLQGHWTDDKTTLTVTPGTHVCSLVFTGTNRRPPHRCTDRCTNYTQFASSSQFVSSSLALELYSQRLHNNISSTNTTASTGHKTGLMCV